MKKTVKFGVRFKRAIATCFPDSEDVYLGGEPYPRLYWPIIREVAKECDRLGFDSVILPDHVMIGPQVFGAWSTLCAIAASTEHVTLGTLTTNSMRYVPSPSLFAKEIATLDNISDGRLYPLGLGTGYNVGEYAAYGFQFPSFKTRLEQLEETVEIMKLMFTEDKATFKGKHFSINNARCDPKPIQKPFPICIGGVGDRLLRLAAKHADHIDVMAGISNKKVLQERLDWIKKCCAEFGRNYADITISAGCDFWIYENQRELNVYANEFKRAAGKRGASLVKGTPDEIIDLFDDRVKMGITYFTLRWEDLPGKRALRLFAEKVMPHFK
jgi:alkanesulfonate monooxygenase SsuD/methylene tetrahydromethanopterin reductase-like flavin-dependent oxidoreductase (luciferase family)